MGYTSQYYNFLNIYPIFTQFKRQFQLIESIVPLVGFYFILITLFKIFFPKKILKIFHIGRGKGGKVYGKEIDIRQTTFFHD